MNKFDWKSIFANLFGTSTAGLAIVQYVPVEYQPMAALVLALVSNLFGLYQTSPVE